MPHLKIYFRYLFARLFAPFAVCICACTLIYIMVDIYGNLEDFLEHKGSVFSTVWIILRFYSLQIPNMLVTVLPAALLISTMWTLLALNRRSELVAFQAGGMAPFWLFSPFLVFALLWTLALAFDMNWPAPLSLVTRDRLLDQVKGQSAKSGVFTNLAYKDRMDRRSWFFESLDTNQGTAQGVLIRRFDAEGNDIDQYFAQRAEYTPGGIWRLYEVVQIVYTQDGGVGQTKNFEQVDTDLTTPPRQISLVVSQPEQLTVSQLSQYIATSTSSPENLAKFRTEWWYRMIYPFSVVVLTFYGLLQGARIDRRNAATGVFKTILLLFFYLIVSNLVLQMGVHDKLPPFLAALAAPLCFGVVGAAVLAGRYGWWWQALAFAREWWGEKADSPEKVAGSSAPNG